MAILLTNLRLTVMELCCAFAARRWRDGSSVGSSYATASERQGYQLHVSFKSCESENERIARQIAVTRAINMDISESKHTLELLLSTHVSSDWGHSGREGWTARRRFQLESVHSTILDTM